MKIIRRRRDIERADQITWAILVSAGIRGIVWLILISCVLGGKLGIPWLHWASTLGNAIVFITLISLYANAEGEFSQVTAAWAALRAGRAHAQAAHGEDVGVERHDEILKRIEAMTETIYEQQLRGER